MAEFSVNNEGQATDSEAETPLLSVLEDESASQVLNSDAKYLLRACKMDVNEVAIRSYVTPTSPAREPEETTIFAEI